jgi:hypothetical protein
MSHERVGEKGKTDKWIIWINGRKSLAVRRVDFEGERMRHSGRAARDPESRGHNQRLLLEDPGCPLP